jgi:hypothetical protein
MRDGRAAPGPQLSEPYPWLMMTNANSRPIRIGVQIAPQHVDYSAIRSASAHAEDIGVDIR